MNTSYNNLVEQEFERKNKRKSRKVVFFLLVGIMALATAPIFNFTLEEEKPDPIVVLDFRKKKDITKSSTKASTEGAPAEQQKKKTPEKKEIPQIKPIPTSPPVIKTERPAPIVPPTPPLPKKPKVVIKPNPIPVTTPKPSNIPVKVKPTKVSTQAGSGNGSSGSGTATSTDYGTSNTEGDGTEGMDFSGDGIFGRRVIYRADVADIIKTNGTIVINLCINQQGRVVYAEANEELTDIEDKKLIDKTVKVAKKYKFEKDYTAPSKECGKLSFIFEIEG